MARGGRTLRRLGVGAMVVPLLGLVTLALAPSAGATGPTSSTGVAPNATSEVDCNGWSPTYQSVRPGMRALCTDPIAIKGGHAARFIDNGWYVGHDEPSVKFISHAAGSGNTMTYYVQLPVDPTAAPTASGSVTDYAELSPAPWFGLPICDPLSYPQNPCQPDSDTNIGTISSARSAGSAMLELQLYPPGFTPFVDNTSCSATQWCSALTIDSLACNFNFKTCNPKCEEPVNFAFLETNGVPAGPPSPQLVDLASYLGNGQTLKMNPGDVLEVSISDPSAGLTTTIDDLTTATTGTMTASAANGFMDTDMATCDGQPFTFHAEYATAAKANQVPWAALEGGVLMEQETGHFETCNTVAYQDGFTTTLADGSTYNDPNVYQTCVGGSEGAGTVGSGPCNAKTGLCHNATTEGTTGPISCPTENAGTGQLCEFSDGYCIPKGTRTVTIDGVATQESARVAGCAADQWQNGDLDFDGTPYQSGTWPDGSPEHPTSLRYVGPFDAAGDPYPTVQFETDVAGSEFLCDTTTGTNCDVKPLGSAFYPFWSLNNSQTLTGLTTPQAACVWNFGNADPGVTTKTFGKDAQYGTSDTARYGGTVISPPTPNPEFSGTCPSFTG